MNNYCQYRVWDKNQNKMLIPQDNINYCYVGGYAVSIEVYKSMDGSIRPVIRPTAIYDNAVLMQCTGLKDKNGTLIYEGDVVKIFLKSLQQEIIDVVEWDNTAARFNFAKFGQISIYI